MVTTGNERRRELADPRLRNLHVEISEQRRAERPQFLLAGRFLVGDSPQQSREPLQWG